MTKIHNFETRNSWSVAYVVEPLDKIYLAFLDEAVGVDEVRSARPCSKHGCDGQHMAAAS